MQINPPLEGDLFDRRLDGRETVPLGLLHQRQQLLVLLHQQQHHRPPVEGVLAMQGGGDFQNVPFQVAGIGEGRVPAAVETGNGGADLLQPALAGHGRTDHRDAELLLQQADIDLHADPFGLVEDVHHQQHRQARLDQLQSHRQHPLEVAGVDDVNHDVGRLDQEDLPRHPFFLGDRHQGVHSRGIEDLIARPLDVAVSARDFHRSSRVVGDRRVGSGQGIEHHALADVGVADEDDPGSGRGGAGGFHQ